MIWPALAGCSSSGSSWGSNQAANAPAAVPPPPAQTSASSAYDARASIYPQRSLVDEFRGSTDPRTAPDPSGAGYPLQPLFSSTPSAQAANMPHPPSTYTPSGQPYVPPQGQAAYAAPPAGQQTYASQQAYAAPQNYGAVPATPLPVAPPSQPPPAEPHISGYPSQSLFDLFRGSTESQTVPRPPSTYTPSGQPYSPPGQPSAGAPQAATAAAPPPAEETHITGYPSQSITDVFRQ